MADASDASVAGGAESGATAVEALRAHPRVHFSRDTLAASGLEAPRRIVSLVPSLSEAIERLGLGHRLVGVTDYCVHPAGAFDALPKLGGTKDADVEAIARQAPDLVIANQEENTARVVRQLAERDISVWVTYPRTVADGVRLLEEMADLGASDAARAAQVAPSRRAYDAAEAERTARRDRGDPGVPVFCPIWRDPWMTIDRDTFIHDVLDLCGGANVFADGPPARGGSAAQGAGAEGGANRRYPVVTLEEVEAAAPEVILLPDEPYRFGEADSRALSGLDVPAARTDRIHLIDGTHVSWYGPRIAEAIQGLARLLARS